MTVRDLYESYPYPAVSPEESQEHFSEIASLTYGQYERCRMAISSEGKKILIVGCGTGNDLNIAHNSNHGHAELIGVDLSVASIGIAKERIKTHNLIGCEVMHLDISEPDAISLFECGQFDFIMAYGVLHHIPRVDVALANIKILLAPEGVFSGMVYSEIGRSRKYAFKRALKKLGVEYPSPENIAFVKNMLYNSHPRSSLHGLYFKKGFFDIPDAHIADDLLHPYDHPYTPQSWNEVLGKNGFEMLAVSPSICHWTQQDIFTEHIPELEDKMNAISKDAQYEVINLMDPESIDRIEFFACHSGSKIESGNLTTWVINPLLRKFSQVTVNETHTYITVIGSSMSFSKSQKDIVDCLLSGQVLDTSNLDIRGIDKYRIQSFMERLEKVRIALQVSQ